MFAQENPKPEKDTKKLRFQIKFEGLSLITLAKKVEQVTGKSFLFPDRFPNTSKVTLISNQWIDADEFFKVFESILLTYGYTISEVPGREIQLYRLTKTGGGTTALKASGSTKVYTRPFDIPVSDRMVTYALRVNHISPKELSATLKSYLANGSIIPVQGKPILLINDLGTNIPRLLEISAILDTSGSPKTTLSIQLKHASAETCKKELQEFLKENQAQQKKSNTNLIIRANKRTNSLFLAGQNEDIELAKNYLKALDQEIPSLKRQVKFYRLKYVKVEEVIDEITDLLQAKKATLNIAGQPTVTPNTGNKKGNTNDILIMPFVPQNALVLAATQKVQDQCQALLKEMDISRPQVLIEVAIVQFSTTSDTNLGLEWFGSLQGLTTEKKGSNVAGGQGFGLSTQTDTNNDGVPDKLAVKAVRGFVLSYEKFNYVQVMLKMLQTDTKVNIVSQPLLMVSNNETANFTTKVSEPTVTTSQGTATTNTSFGGYAEAKTSLKIIPSISPKGHVVLDISQDFEEFSGPGSSSGIPSSKTSNSFQTKVTVPDGSTVILGGFVRDSNVETFSKVPFLGSIPLLGYLFRSTETKKVKSRLYLFVRPHVLKDDDFSDLKAISQEKKDDVKKLDKEASKKLHPEDSEDDQKEDTTDLETD